MYQSWRKVHSGVRQSGPGFIVPASGGPTLRAVVLNGTSQNAHVDVPNAAPWNSMPAFKIVFRMRGFSDDANRRTMTIVGATYDATLNTGLGSGRIDFTDSRDSIQIFHTPTSLTDIVMKLQFDPSNTRWTLESWKADGTGHVQGTVALTTTSNLDYSDVVYFGSTTANGLNSNAHFDWIYFQSGADALNVFPGAEPPAGSFYSLWTFDADDGADTSGNGLTLILQNSPTFENTP